MNTIKDKVKVILFFVTIALPFVVDFYLRSAYMSFRETHYPYFYSYLSFLFAQFFFLLLLFCVCCTFGKFRKIVVGIWALLIFIPASIELVSVCFTKLTLNANFLLTIFDSTREEIIYCLSHYCLYIFLNICIIAFVFLVKLPKNLHVYLFTEFNQNKHNQKTKTIPNSTHNKKYFWLSHLLLIICLIVSNKLPIHTIIGSYDRYLYCKEEAKKYSLKRHLYLSGIDNESDSKATDQTYVIVIGESVDRKHMGLYGYDKPTTPFFSELASKNELFVFRNVISSSVFTNSAVGNLFSIETSANNRKNSGGNEDTLDNNNYFYSLLYFFSDAGFKTFWISNQAGVDDLDLTITRFGRLCDESVFLGSSRFPSKFDEILLEPFENALKDKAKKKLIILHFMGSHFPIWERYPKEFVKFKIPKVYKYKKKAFCVSAYDNSILYTDHCLKEIIKRLKKYTNYSAMLYLSDHGQDVWDTDECEIQMRTWPDGYEIPFVIWVSDKYREKNREFIENWSMDVPYVSDRTAYTIIDLARLRHRDVDDKLRERSIFEKDSARTAAVRQKEIQEKVQ